MKMAVATTTHQTYSTNGGMEEYAPGTKQTFKYIDVTGVATVPRHNKYTPWTMVPNGASCRIKRTFFVAE